MAQILSIETSTDVCGVALLRHDELVSEAIINRPRVHAEQLTSLMDAVVERGGAAFSVLDAVAVSAGPGSYTGLRIGVSAAKGLAYVHDLPLISVSSLEVMAAEAAPCARPNDRILAVRSARKKELFCALFRVDPGPSDGTALQQIVEGQVAELEQLPDLLQTGDTGEGPLWIVGTGRDAALEHLGGSARPFAGERPSPTAYWVGRLAAHRFRRDEFEDIAAFEPDYLRPFHTHERRPTFDRLPGKP